MATYYSRRCFQKPYFGSIYVRDRNGMTWNGFLAEGLYAYAHSTDTKVSSSVYVLVIQMSVKGCRRAKHKTYSPLNYHWAILSTSKVFNFFP